MARDFTPKEAKQIIQQHLDLLRALNELAGSAQTVRREFHDAERMLFDGADRSITHEIEGTQNGNLPAPSFDRFISSLYYYQKIRPIAATAKRLLEYHDSDIKDSLARLAPGTSNIQWLFSNARTKEQATSAFHHLRELLCGNYPHSIHAMRNDASSLRDTPYTKIWEDFQADRANYHALFHRLIGNRAGKTDQLPLFSVLTDKLEKLEHQIQSWDNNAVSEREQIKTSALQLAASESLSLLRDVPVEELNREKSGIRVKLLREHGYSTMADIYAASAYQLESIRGISTDAAYTIKRVANNYAKQVINNAKIRLSQDRRTREATALVTSVYGYRYRSQKRKELHDAIAPYTDPLTFAKQILKQFSNKLDWFFYTDHQKNEVRSAYFTLKQLLSGEYGKVVAQHLAALKAKDHIDSEEAWKDFSENSIAYFNILENIVPGILGNDDILYGLPEDLAREIQEEAFFPDGLLCELRRYQEWGVKYALHQERVLLGDEMGLGKTVQAIATMVSLRNTGATHFIVVCPASVLANWCREIRKMSRLSVTKIHGSDRRSATLSWIKTGGVAVTTYETTGHLKLDADFKFSLMVVDEAHYIKNPDAQRTMNVQKIGEHADRLLFMTGTALENKVDEMVSLINMLQPSVAASVRGMEFMSSAPQFRKKVAPVYYRRKREDVLTELPELIESKEWCTMTAREEAVYEDSILGKRYSDARRVSWNVDDPQSSKAKRMMELIETARSEGRKVIVFSFFLDTIKRVMALVGDSCFGPINGSITPQRRQELIDEFDKAPAGSVLAAQIQAGGTGLNIQSASVVIICEPQFKPSIENQAISRAYRMGQTRNVLVYRLLCENTVDEKITSMLESKQAIFDAFADKSVAAAHSMEVDDKTFGNIIKEEIDRINAKRASVENARQ